MFFTRADKEIMDYVETEFDKYQIFQHGLPLGIGFVDITTNSADLEAFVKRVEELMKAAETNESSEAGRQIRSLLRTLQGTGGEDSEWQLHNHWNSAVKYKGAYRQVWIWKSKKDGSYRTEINPFSKAMARSQMLVATCTIRAACTLVETENIARERLLEELDELQKRQYILTDSFEEVGKSGVVYILRRNRPTLAFRMGREADREYEAELLCGLCMHPLAYYTGSWAGVMPPSDEILAHLLHIRSDEHRYWKVCNQLQPSNYLCGL